MIGFLAFLAYLLFWIPSLRQGLKDIRLGDWSEFSVWRKKLRWGIAGTFLFIVLNYFSGFYVKEYLWFNEVGYTSVLWTAYKVYFTIFGLSALTAAFVIWFGLWLVRRTTPQIPEEAKCRRKDRSELYSPEDFFRVEARCYRILTRFVTPFVAFIFGYVSAGIMWGRILLYLHQVPTDGSDPVFGRDFAFWLFSLPVFHDVLDFGFFLWFATCTLAAIYCVVVLSKLDETFLWKEQKTAERNYIVKLITGAVGFGAFLFAGWYWLGCYDLLFSTSGAAFGAGYTDVNARLTVYGFMTVAFFLLALFLIVRSFFCNNGVSLKHLAWGGGGFLLVWFLFTVIYPSVFVQALTVQRNEFVKEEPYITRTIEYTRKAYGLGRLQTKEFQPEELTREQFEKLPEVRENIRLWDWRVTHPIYNQLQGFRLYYEFPDVDVDRYEIDGALRQVMIAARELVPERLPARTWINERLKYTHGYGVILHYGNAVTANGHPEFVIGDIPLYTPDTLRVTRPEVYFGELTSTPVVVGADEKEFDYPSGEKNAETVYTGNGGIPLGSGLRRLAIAWEFDGWQVLTSPRLKPESKIMFRREILGRLRTIAPFIVWDSDPCVVIRDDGTLVYLVVGYTVSDSFPYSESHSANLGGQSMKINYIRNSVQAVVDAYHGSVSFFVTNPADPIIQAWRRAFPDLFRSLEEMPPDLIGHLRYGEDYFRVQSSMLLDYHVINPMVFYNKEDRWSVGEEQFEDNRQLVEPYYIIDRLPDGSGSEMLLTIPFTPLSSETSRKENLVGWLAARMDGEHYGNMLLYQFPKGMLRYGTMQVEAQIDQEKEMSAQITLWNQSGSKVVRGHLLVIPVGNSIFYAEPFYIRSTTSSLPQLQKVILATQRPTGQGKDLKLHLVWGDTLDEAFVRLFAQSFTVTKQKKGEGEQHMPEEIIAFAREHLKAYSELTAKGDFAGAGEELQALRSLLQ